MERNEASGPAEQRATHLCELPQALIEDARARGSEVSLEHMIAKWANRHSNCGTSPLVNSGLEVEGAGVVQAELIRGLTLKSQLELTLHVFWRHFWFDDVRRCQSNQRCLFDWNAKHKCCGAWQHCQDQ